MKTNLEAVYTRKLEEGVFAIYLNQPEKKNAISESMMVLMNKLLVEVDEDEKTRVVIVRGVGENFSSGGDLTQSASEDWSPERSRQTLRHYTRVIQTMRRMTKPLIAMVDGYVVGGAFSLVLASDLVCASNRSSFIPAFCQIGIIPEMGMMKFLPELVGAQRAKEMLFLGGAFSSEHMQKLGLVNRV
ncbi:MAG: enoyl-CoA hydratase/isomerase family protein, partial [Coriobacteriales bacterium]|nr:enoyl-CoA hydratase/isomerase family protein [Coriobacteriales bacterium]